MIKEATDKINNLADKADDWFKEKIAGKVSFPITEEEARLMTWAAFIAGSNEGIDIGKAFVKEKSE